VTKPDPYLYPNSDVLRNKLHLHDAALLEGAERRLVVQRMSEGIPTGSFDLDHLRAIHFHLFQDLYDWAGELRHVEIAKGGDQFQFRRFIEVGISNIHGRLEKSDYLKGLDMKDFAEQAAIILGDVNYVHPFRDGNGRVQLQYLRLLAAGAGHPIDLTRLDRTRWLKASRAAHRGNYALLAAEILGIG
jgi:cell filamentation protein